MTPEEKREQHISLLELDTKIFPKLFPGYKRSKDLLSLKKWINYENKILNAVNRYINKNMLHIAEFTYYYSPNKVSKETLPFKNFVDEVIYMKQWSFPGVRMSLSKDAFKHKQMLGRQHQLWGALSWIVFHISILSNIFQLLVENNYIINEKIKNLLPISESNKKVYQHFWFPIHTQISNSNRNKNTSTKQKSSSTKQKSLPTQQKSSSTKKTSSSTKQNKKRLHTSVASSSSTTLRRSTRSKKTT